MIIRILQATLFVFLLLVSCDTSNTNKVDDRLALFYQSRWSLNNFSSYTHLNEENFIDSVADVLNYADDLEIIMILERVNEDDLNFGAELLIGCKSKSAGEYFLTSISNFSPESSKTVVFPLNEHIFYYKGCNNILSYYCLEAYQHYYAVQFFYDDQQYYAEFAKNCNSVQKNDINKGCSNAMITKTVINIDDIFSRFNALLRGEQTFRD